MAETPNALPVAKDPLKCQSCEVQPARALHECPFAAEIHNDFKQCDCCEKCTHQCCMEI